MRDLVSKHFDEWARVSELPSGDAAVETFLSALAKSKLLLEDSRERFARILVELATTRCLGSVPEPAQAREPDLTPGVSFGVTPISKSANESSNDTQKTQKKSLSFAAVDAVVRLIASLCRRAEISPEKRPALLASALAATARAATRDADERGAMFDPRPYHRLILGLMVEMHAPDVALDASHPQVLASFAGALLALQPSRAPGFAYAWLELISHRCFLPRLLADRERAGWPTLRRLLVAALTFLEPFLRAAALSETVRLLYRGTLRLLLVLLHDFPEFLCDHHLDLCDVIPPNCVQMRNLVLSAFPRAMRLPDPFTPNLKVDLLPEISQSPRVTCGADDALKTRFPALRSELDQFLETRQPAGFPDRLRRALALSPPAAAAAARALRRAVGQRGRAALRRARRRGERGRRAHVRGRRVRQLGGLAPGAHRAHGGVPAPSRRSGRRGALRVSQRRREPAAVPQRAHALLLVRVAVLVLGERLRGCARADHARATGAPDREPAAPLGFAGDVHRAHQEPAVQLLGARVHAVRAGYRAAV